MLLHAVVICQLYALPNGIVVVKSNDDGYSTSTLTCNDGYSLEGNSERKCLHTGLWTGTLPSCKGNMMHSIHSIHSSIPQKYLIV